MRLLMAVVLLLAMGLPAWAQYSDDSYNSYDTDDDNALHMDGYRDKHHRDDEGYREMQESAYRMRQDLYRAEMLEYQEKILREMKKQNGTATFSDYGRPVCNSTGCY